MSLRTALLSFARVLADEAERNPHFAGRIREALCAVDQATGQAAPASLKSAGPPGSEDRPRNRRAPATLDPIATAEKGENVLRRELNDLTLEQLRDVVVGQPVHFRATGEPTNARENFRELPYSYLRNGRELRRAKLDPTD